MAGKKTTTTVAAYPTSPPKLRRIASHDGKPIMETLDRVLTDALVIRGLPPEIPVADDLAKECDAILPATAHDRETL